MGSPYLLAHGLGRPVDDAVTKFNIGESGNYRLWVRTKDWVARWNATASPGKFQIIIDGSGTGGIDPDYITLANNQITHHKSTTVTNLSAGSIGVGTGGIACFGDLTVGIGGNGTVYANNGIKATAIR